ncbi:beta-propeller fold lactonase family protein [Massilia sp. erpn]|uniref:beta-propeller fold lactonase family protein n=1 Tax=Massilia sp. erpn TaxID=2738142 RepID=UPI002107525F|nr:beta-propeller fold lactonase family protein [Massilia sp. erpn]UTY59274.1 beta-propeller fold lactonase family protein [Massilia sp. erpn]
MGKNRQIRSRLVIATAALAVCLLASQMEVFGGVANGSAGTSHSSAIALSDDGRLLWSINPDSDEVTVIRTDTLVVIKTIAVGRNPQSVALSPNGQYAYVTNAGDGTVSFIKIRSSDPDKFVAALDSNIGKNGQLTTGSEPRGVVVSSDGRMVFVANSSQDSITAIDATTNRVVESYLVGDSACNDVDDERHFQPTALAISPNNRYLFVTRFLSFTSREGVQASELGKEGIVCRLTVELARSGAITLRDPTPIRMAPQIAGFNDPAGKARYAFPNQLQSVVLRDGTAYLPNIAASPTGPIHYATTTQAFINAITDVESTPKDAGALNLHLGGRVPEKNKQELYFANPNAIGFTTTKGEGYAYVTSGGSDLLVKLRVLQDGQLVFTENGSTTRYVDLNDPDEPSTSGFNAGKNPIGLAINAKENIAYVLNYVSRNVSVVDLDSDRVVKVIPTSALPAPGSQEEKKLVGAELFFSSRGNFVNPSGLGNSRNRLSEKGRQSCASCHPSGLTDGVVWQFNTGPRKTLAINGTFNPRDPSDQKIINASAIFDEVQDADFNTRLTSSPGMLKTPRACVTTPGYPEITESKVDPDHGLVLGEHHEFRKAACVMTQFSVPNSTRAQATVLFPGSNVEIGALDALKEWQQYGVRTPMRAMTERELRAKGGDAKAGVNAERIAEGRRIFKEYGCNSCHNGGKWSTSSRNFALPPEPDDIAKEAASSGANQFQFLYKYLRDIGSYNLNVAGSDNMISGFDAIGGAELDTAGLKALGYDHDGDGKGSGYNIPSILGTYSVPPYYHNGACETLRCVVSDRNHRDAGSHSGSKAALDKKEIASLVKFLQSIDASTAPFK